MENALTFIRGYGHKTTAPGAAAHRSWEAVPAVLKEINFLFFLDIFVHGRHL